MPVQYWDLITYQEVLDRAMDASATVENEQAEVESVIGDVSRRIESHLNRRLIAHDTTDRVERSRFSYDPISEKDVCWAESWPVAEVLTDGYDRLTDRKISGDEDDVPVSYVAGYLREDQDLTDLQAEVPDATVAPGVLPDDIRGAALDLVLSRVRITADEMLGVQGKEQQIGRNMLRVTGVDAGFERRTLRALDRYKKRI